MVFGRIFGSFPADESQAGTLPALASDGEMRSAGVVIDAGNVVLGINDIECGEKLLVIASIYDEALFDPDDGQLSGAVFTKMAWVCNGGRSSPVSVGRLREYVHELTDAKNTAHQITDSSVVTGWRLTGATRMPRMNQVRSQPCCGQQKTPGEKTRDGGSV